MPVGDIVVNKMNIGSLNLLRRDECQYVGFNIYEDLFNPYGPTAEIKVNDFTDCLGRYNLNGKEKIEIDFSLYEGKERVKFDLMSYENSDLDDRSKIKSGAMKSKTYIIKCVSPEYLNVQSKSNIQKSYNLEIHKIIEDLVKNTGFSSKKQFINDDPTKGKIRHIATGHPLNIYQQLNNRAVSLRNKSSAYVLYVSDNKYMYRTIEQCCKDPEVLTLSQSTTLGAGASEQQKQNSITSILVGSSFFSPPRYKIDTQMRTYDTVTGKANYPRIKPNSQYTHLGNPVYKESGSETSFPLFSQAAYTQHDRVNNKTSTDVASARQNRSAYLGYFAQNHADLVVIGNPKIKLGNIIRINIPNKSTDSNLYESQFSGPVLITQIRHIINPIGQVPRYQMVLRVTKAGGYDRGGE